MDFFNGFNASQNFIDPPADALQVGEAVPPAKRRSGVCIVLGTHPCWEQDLCDAMRAHKHVEICGVNEAGRLTKIDHLATCHGDKIDDFIKLCDGYTPLVHLRDNDAKPDTIDVPHHI